MAPPALNVLFSSELWQRALDSYARAANLTVKLFDKNAQVIFGPVHPTPLFQLLEETSGYDPGIFSECARRCLTQIAGRPAVIVSEFCGLSVVGTSLALDGEIVGAAVGGYAMVDFSRRSEIYRLAQDSGIGFERLWLVAREQRPVPHGRLIINGELLQVLGDSLLRENSRTRKYGAALNLTEGHLRALTQRMITAQEEERRRLARELHDDTMQRMSALQNEIALVRGEMPSEAGDMRKRLEGIENDLGIITDEVRNLSHRLHPSILDDLGLEIATKQLVRDFGTRRFPSIHFQADDVPGNIPRDIATVLFRIAQEALGNIHKHADTARKVVVNLIGSPDEMRLMVEDDGPGFDAGPAAEHAGLGLISMQERALSVGGELKITSSLGQGTKIEAVVPWPEDI